MKTFKYLAAAAMGAMMAATPSHGAELVIPNLSYRTGPFAPSGIPLADGFADYFTLLNERDGGIGGAKIVSPECETAYNTEKGVECYEATKGTALIYNPLSTGLTYQLIPRASADGIPLYTPGYGRTSAADGTVFEWVFNYPANYWDGASVAVNHLLDLNGGKLEGKKIALVYHNSAYGREPIRTLQELSKKHGFSLAEIPVDSPGQEQKSQWLQIRRDKPDYVILYGFGVMNQVSIQEAANIRFPMENLIGVWWSGSENDTRPVGAAATGYKSLAIHGTGKDYPVYADLKKYVYDAGKAAGAGDQVGSVLYSRGIFMAAVIAEAVRTAQEIAGTPDITRAQLREGLERINITEARLAEIGLPNFTPPFAGSCQDHGGPGLAMIQQWDAASGKWNRITDFIQPDRELINALIKEDAAAFAKEAGIKPRC